MTGWRTEKCTEMAGRKSCWQEARRKGQDEQSWPFFVAYRIFFPPSLHPGDPMSTRNHAVAALLSLVAVPLLGAQAPAPPQPGPEHQQLAYFAGRWTSQGDQQATPMGPGGKFSGTETCEWFSGGFYVVCRFEGQGPAGEMKGLGIMGYSGERKRFTYYGIGNDQGEGASATGEVAGDTWNWEGESMMGGQTMKARYTLKVASADSYSFRFEMSMGGGPWTLVQTGTAARAK